MRQYVSALIAFLFLTGIAIGAVGDAGVSDGISSVQPGQGYLAGSGSPSSPTAYKTSQMGASQGASPSLQPSGQPQASGYAAVAPQTGGPYEERMSADDLRLPQLQGESFQPDSDLNFVSATPPSSSEEMYASAYGTGQSVSAGAGQETGSWYYPGSVESRNKFWVQTFSGLKTVAGCSYGGYLPLWSDINAAGNFYVYEWYPGQWTPSVRWWGWTWPGYKKGWFTGDVPGWHILSYNCRDWSNYVYIYVWPTGSGAYSTGYSSGSSYSAGTPAAAATASISNPLPSGAPTPPDPNAENLILPDFNLLTPSNGQSSYEAATSPASFTGGAAGTPTAVTGTATSAASYPALPQSAINYPIQGTIAGYSATYPASNSADYPASYSTTYPFSYSASQPMKSVQTSQSCPGCQASALTGTAAVSGIQAQKTCVGCVDQGSYQSAAVTFGQAAQPYQAASQTYQAVFPQSSTCRCNEYYIQVWPNKLSTVAGLRCGEWLPLWSKVTKPGIYWSFEWTLCGNPAGYYCQPEVKNFGYKNAGWHQTWFRGNKPGWHILCYCSSDWSNYIYIYVWPSS
jgi:hypothetical protein